MMPGPRAERSVRVDLLLVERGFAESRTQAQALVLAGRVRSAGRVLDKPGARISAATELQVDSPPRWASRGGEKLHGALVQLAVVAAGKQALDVGASTGGFTDVLLAAGASAVAALDVGEGQLHWRLRQDPRVYVLDGRNARHLDANDLPFLPSLAVVDVSFIGLEKVLPAIFGCLAPDGEVVALVKPQFEAVRGASMPGGIVRDPAVHRQVLQRLAAFAIASGWAIRGLAPSALRGAEGNREFFLHLARGPGGWNAKRFAAELEAVLAADTP